MSVVEGGLVPNLILVVGIVGTNTGTGFGVPMLPLLSLLLISSGVETVPEASSDNEGSGSSVPIGTVSENDAGFSVVEPFICPFSSH